MGTAPILNEPPQPDDFGQLVRHIGPINVVVPEPLEVDVVNIPDVNVVSMPLLEVDVVNIPDVNVVSMPPIAVGEVTETRPNVGNITTVPASLVSTLLIAANANRRGLVIYNGANRICYVRASTGAATPTNFTFPLHPGDTATFPTPVYTGEVRAIWVGGGLTGHANITEFVGP